jgi:plasmid stability protein
MSNPTHEAAVRAEAREILQAAQAEYDRAVTRLAAARQRYHEVFAADKVALVTNERLERARASRGPF